MATISGGRKFEVALRDLARKVARPATLRVGFLENARYPIGESVAMIAAFNEYGVPSHGQPPRPAFRNMIAAKSGEWPAAIAALLKANDLDVVRTLQMTGEAIAGQLRESISTIMSPPLKPATIARKGFDKPWIETAHLLHSVDYDVKQ